MCGISGWWDASATFTPGEVAHVAGTMADCLSHRGPDAGGNWADPEVSVGFGHRRLSVIDLSPAGEQPMRSANGRYTITFNGEIYNHAELRGRLHQQGVTFRGTSDTEVLVECLDVLGIEDTLRALDGMFAFGAWDAVERRLVLARDKIGEKPLYYGMFGPSFLFGSELKSLWAHPHFDAAIDPSALRGYLQHGFVGGSNSIHDAVARLRPGTWLEVRQQAARHTTRAWTYWSFSQVASDGISRRGGPDGSPADHHALYDVVRDAVRSRMVADVPVGAFLSGGIDSSLVAACMQDVSEGPVTTFSMGFEDRTIDEAPHAARVAGYLGTEHHELYVSDPDMLEVVPRLAAVYDEPFGDSSQIPTMLVSMLARQHVTVALSGDGGDELFGGYTRYHFHDRWWARLSRLPLSVRRAAARGLTSLSPSQWDALTDRAPGGPASRLGDKLHKAASVITIPTAEGLYDRLLSHVDDASVLMSKPPVDQAPASRHGLLPGIDGLMLADSLHYLPDDILVKVDRAAMATSLETRVPLLAPTVVEYAWGLSMDDKVDGGAGKHLLKEALCTRVPRPLIERPKAGFSTPLSAWLTGPLRPWVEDLLSAHALDAHGLLDTVEVRHRWRQHLDGHVDHKYHLWDLVMFQAWHQEMSRQTSRRTIRLSH